MSTNEPRDYFRQIDLNQPVATGGPINQPSDARALHYFGFLSQGQQLQLLDGLPVGNAVLFSFRYVEQPGLGPVPPMPQADGALDFAFGPPTIMRWENSHDRAHVLVWIDGPALPVGQLCRVRVSGWKRE
ncbi:MAG: hypothetical protein V4515_15190 [Chloroflexota bacterium]